MAYLRGNSVVDGDLYVEGDILVRAVRPEENGAVFTLKGENQGTVRGRHLRCDSGTNGTLIDSSLIETRPGITDNKVELRFTWNNDSNVDSVTISNFISTLYITENIDSNTGLSNDLKAMNMSKDPVTGTPIVDEISISDIDKYADKITTWRYIQS